MNLYTGLLFQQGHIQDPALALSLAGVETASKPQDARESGDIAPPSAQPSECKAPFRRGAIFTVCSTALSPFR